ncbi:MAG: hypothetical protein AAF311_15920 [Pseudomonadota bacterium]
MISRRDLALMLAAGAAGMATARKTRAAETTGAHDMADDILVHDMSGMPDHWVGDETFVMLMYPRMTALDLVGPEYMFASLMGAKVHLVAR